MESTQVTSSQLIPALLGNVDKYKKPLLFWINKLCKKYSSKNLAPIFSTLDKHSLTIGPMLLFDILLLDLGLKTNKKIMTAIGLICLVISTHDDVVDETPKNKESLASLIYAGNLAYVEGIKLILQTKRTDVLQIILDTVGQNHYLQQLVIEKLWQGKRISKNEYLEGRKDGQALVAIGPLAALAYAKKLEFRKRILRFSAGLGMALQLIDDIREIKDDFKTPYRSLPMMENPPFKESFKELYNQIVIARSGLKKDWKRMNHLVNKLEILTKKVQEKINNS